MKHSSFAWSLLVSIALLGCADDPPAPAPEPNAVAREAPPAAPFDVQSVVRRIHFSFRPEGNRLTGGHSTYASEVEGAKVRVSPVHHSQIPLPGRPGRDRFAPPTVGTPLELETIAIGRDGIHVMPIELPVVSGDGHVIRAGAVVSEEIENKDQGVEVRWSFAARPPGKGDLEVRVRPSGLEFAAETPSGMHFRDPQTHLGVRYGHATWIDAGGARTDVPVRLAGGDLVMRVPARIVDASSFPAVLDPMIGPETGIDAPVTGPASGGQYQASVAYSGSNYFLSWNDYRASSYSQCYGTRVSTAGAVLDPSGILIGEPGVYCYNPSVVYDGSNYLVVFERQGYIVGRRFNTGGTAVDSFPFTIGGAGSGSYGSFAFNNGIETFVAWYDYRNYSVSGSDIYGRRVSGGTPLGSDIAVATPAGDQYYARVTYGGGNWFIVWQDYRTGGGNPDVYGARVSAAGVPLGETAITTLPAYQYNPWPASNGTDYFVVWQDDRNNPTSGNDIYGARVTSAGVLSDPSGIQVVNNTQYQYSPSVAYNGGNYQVVWSDNRGPGLYGGRVNAAGTLIDGPGGVLISSAVANYPNEPRIFATGTGFYVAWGSYVGEASNGDLLGSRMTTGLSLQDAPGTALAQTANGQTQVDLASDGTNRWFVVWNDDRAGGRAIYGARVDNSGASMDPAGILLSSGGLYEQYPSVAYNGSQYLVVWTDSRSPSWGVWGTRVNATTGAVIDPAGLGLFLNSSGNQPYEPEVASDGSGWFVGWYDYRAGYAQIYGGRVSSAGTAQDPTGILISSGGPMDYKYGVQVGYGGGYYLALWADYRSGTSYDLYGARISTAGVVQEPTGIGIATGTAYVNGNEYGVGYVSPNFMIVYMENAEIKRARVASATGTVLDTATLASCCNYRPSIGYDGDTYLVTYSTSTATGYDLRGTRLSTDGTDLDGIDWIVTTGGGVTYDGSVVSGITGKALVAYSRYDGTPGVTSDRIRTRTISRLADGMACTVGADCLSGNCVDGVCCNSACGGGVTTDCQACSVAAGGSTDGVCGAAGSGITCRPAASTCDAAETCTGTSTTCPADAFAAAGTECRASIGVCDAAETCTGTSGTCPANAFAPATTECRASTGVCDAAEFCNGLSATCPGNGFSPASVVCRPAAGACDVDDHCTGTSATCPTDVHAGPTVECRAASGACDLPETCDGDIDCPPNQFAPSGTSCRAAADLCDVEESCTGISANCPSDAFAMSGTVCRPSTDDCDPQEICSGASASCPADAFDPDGADCDDGMACTLGDMCEGGVCQPGTPDPSCMEPIDAGLDATPADADTSPDAEPGIDGDRTPLDCDCRVASAPTAPAWPTLLFLALLALLVVRRR